MTGRNGAGKSSLLRMIAGLLRIAGGTLVARGRRRGAQHRRTGALSRPSGRAQTLAVGDRESRLLERMARRRAATCRATRWRAVGLDTLAALAGGLSFGRAEAAACRSRGWSRSRARSGCSTSRPPRSIAPRRRCCSTLMREHLAARRHDRRRDPSAARPSTACANCSWSARHERAHRPVHARHPHRDRGSAAAR